MGLENEMDLASARDEYYREMWKDAYDAGRRAERAEALRVIAGILYVTGPVEVPSVIELEASEYDVEVAPSLVGFFTTYRLKERP